jgi:hypothetical protein
LRPTISIDESSSSTTTLPPVSASPKYALSENWLSSGRRVARTRSASSGS